MSSDAEFQGSRENFWRNSARRYGMVAMALHWLMALLVFGLLAAGLFMVSLENNVPLKFQIYQLHKSVGVTVLFLALLRIGWRFINPPPQLPSGQARWEIVAAHATHMMLYILMLVLPLSGWVMVSLSPWNIPTILYGLVPWPHLPLKALMADSSASAVMAADVHRVLAYCLMGLLALHIVAALVHQYVLRTNVLRRMIPGTKV